MNFNNQKINNDFGDNTSLVINLLDLNDRSIFINWSNEERKRIFNQLLRKTNLSDFARSIDYDISTICDVKNGNVKPSGYVYVNLLKILNLDKDVKSLEISSRNFGSIKIKKNYINPELIGLIHSDGHMNLKKEKNGCVFQFCNQNKNLINRFKKLIFQTFECKFTQFKSQRDNTYYLYIQNIIARIISKKIGWKTKNFTIPLLNKKEIPYYLRGIFDGDGTIYLYKNSRIVIPTIRISAESEGIAKNFQQLLNKIGIYSRICHEISKGNNWYNIVITRQKDFIKFIDIIGSSHPKKRRRMDKIKSFLLARKSLSSLTPRS